MDEAGVSYALQAERMGHEVTGMRGVYSHVSEGMRRGLVTALEGFWTESLNARARIAPRSAVGVLDKLLTEQKGAEQASGAISAPNLLPKTDI